MARHLNQWIPQEDCSLNTGEEYMIRLVLNATHTRPVICKWLGDHWKDLNDVGDLLNCNPEIEVFYKQQ